jgi:hypothetical protein
LKAKARVAVIETRDHVALTDERADADRRCHHLT